ncbi:Gluconate transport-inducing protein [Microbotryomycetes sp. JL201]|nr:Gluconate transport-inducing protein [Microbotryomycetes sp. JL201]
MKRRSRLVKPGAVFVWEEEEAGIRRWTDHIKWSPSRVSGPFLTYTEVPPRGEDSLVKQSFSSIDSQGTKMHLIAYTTRATSILSHLPIAASDDRLKELMTRRKRDLVEHRKPDANVHPGSPESFLSRPSTSGQPMRTSPSPPLQPRLHRVTSSSSLADGTAKLRASTSSDGAIRSRPVSVHDLHFRPYSPQAAGRSRSSYSPAASSSAPVPNPARTPPLGRHTVSAPPSTFQTYYGYSPPPAPLSNSGDTRPSTSSSSVPDPSDSQNRNPAASAPFYAHYPLFSAGGYYPAPLPPPRVLASGLPMAQADSPPPTEVAPTGSDSVVDRQTVHHPRPGLFQPTAADPPSPPPPPDRWRMSEDERQLSLFDRRL